MFLAKPFGVDLFQLVGNFYLGKHVFGVLIDGFFAVDVVYAIRIERHSRGFNLGSILFSLPLLAFALICFV